MWGQARELAEDGFVNRFIGKIGVIYCGWSVVMNAFKKRKGEDQTKHLSLIRDWT